VNAITKKDLNDLKTKAGNGVHTDMIDFIDHSDEDTLFSIVDRYVPAFMSVLMTMALNRVANIDTYEKSGLITTIMDVRKKVDRTKVSGIVVPHRLSKYMGIPIADARELAIADCYKF
jgi:hypothetical protein